MRSQLRGVTRLILWFSFSVVAYSQSPDSFVGSVKGIYSQDGLREGNAFDHRSGRQGRSMTPGGSISSGSAFENTIRGLRKRTPNLHVTDLHQDDQYYDDRFYFGGLDWTVWGSTIHQEELYIGGNFEWYNGEVRLNGIARWDGEGWQPVGDGFNGTVYALVSYNDGLIAAGDFTQSGSTSVNRIARWNGSSWQPLGDGFNWEVYALTVYNNVLIAGGYFDIDNWIDVARWDGENWLAVGEGFDNGSIFALTVYDGDLIAGGSFTQSNGAPVNGIARWNGSSWQSIGNGFDDAVEALAMYNNELIAGGWFEQSGNVTVNSIARWNGTSWQPMSVGFDSDVYALIEYNGARPFFRTIRSLGEIYKPLADAVHELRDGGRKIVKIQTMDDIFHLALNATVFKLGGDRYTLVSFQNIGRELEEKEMEAWQNLIRVLTHEIMNSVTPIASLASTGSSMVRKEIYDESIDDIRDAFQTIEKRSEGLLHFINAYRNLTRIPKPSFQITPVKDIFNTMVRLLNAQIAESDIIMETSIEPTRLEVTADPELIEQVLINLLKNSIEALMHTKGAKIRLSARIDGQGRVVMHVADNGPGIVPEAIDKIFIPFFTTKENGSGIGLSLARQIMRLHGGSINVRSEAGIETVFSLRF